MLVATARLTLREFEETDVAALRRYHADPRYLEHYEKRPDTSRIVELARVWEAETPRRNFQLIIALGSEGPVVGSVGLRSADHPRGEAEIGIEVHPSYWGCGYAGEALGELLRFGVHELALTRVLATTARSNFRMRRLLERLAFVEQSSSATEIRYALSVAAEQPR